MKSMLRIALLFSYVGMIGSLATTNVTWDSTSSTDFTVGGNWSSGNEPGYNSNAGSDVAYFTGVTNVQTSVVLNSSDSITGITFSNTAPSFTLSGSGVLTTTSITDSSANTEYLNGSYYVNSGGGQFNAKAGEMIFGSGSTLAFTGNTSGLSASGSSSIQGTLQLGGNLNWSNTAGTLYVDTTSVTNLSGNALTTQTIGSLGGGGIIDLQQNVNEFAGLVVGYTSSYGAIYVNAGGLSLSLPITMNSSSTSNTYTNATYYFGMNAAGSAASSVSGKITLQNYGNDTSTDDFDVQNNNTLTISGQITATTGSISGTPGSTANSSVKKTGTGTLILSNTGTGSSSNNYGGSTTVSAGTLGVTATTAIPTTTALSVASGANFAVGNAAGGSYIGPVGPTVASLSLTSTGSSVGNEAELSFNIGGTSYDSLTSTGAFTLNGAGTTFELNVNVVGGSTGTDTLLTWLNAGSTNLSLSNVDLVVNGTDIGTSNSTYLTLNTGTNDSIAFNAAAAPEPRAWALMLGGVGLLVFVTRRRAIRSDI